jgi:hypothetical protein
MGNSNFKAGDLVALRFPARVLNIPFEIGTVCLVVEDNSTNEACMYTISIDGLIGTIPDYFIKKLS